MQMTPKKKKKANDLHNLFAAFAALAAALFTPPTAARAAQQPATYTHVIFANEPWVAGDPTGRREVFRFDSRNSTTTGREIMARYWAQTWQQMEDFQAKIKAEGLVYSPAARGFVAPHAAKRSDAFYAAFALDAEPIKSPASLDRRRPLHSPKP